MLKQARRTKWSVLVMRDAGQNVKQFRVSKRSVFAAPAAAVLAISGCIAGLQIRNAYEISRIEEAMAEKEAELARTARMKETAAASVQRELEAVKKQAAAMKIKLQDLEALEAKLKRFTEAYGDVARPSGAVNASPEDAASAVGNSETRGNYSAAAEARHLVQMAAVSGLDFRAVSRMVDAMEETMAESVRKARQRKAELAALPSGWPTVSHRLTSGFGYRKDPFTGRTAFHAGIDIAGNSGDPVFAAADGIVTETGTDNSKGNYIVITHDNGLKTAYYHLKRIEAEPDQRIVRGEKIALLGSTGRSTAPHLHFQIMQEDQPVNPFEYLRQATHARAGFEAKSKHGSRAPQN